MGEVTIKTVFISSTMGDLKDYRQAVYDAVESLDGYHCIGMERFGARDAAPDEFCAKMATECDLYVGIIGHFYGSSPPGSDISYTELEYDAATEAQRPRLVFLAADELKSLAPEEQPEKKEKLAQFQAKVNAERVRDRFSSPTDLACKVVIALRNWEKDSEAGSQAARPVVGDDLREALLIASKTLLQWPTTLGNGREMQRPELAFLHQRVQTHDHTATILLGPPGSGKSALLAMLGRQLAIDGTTFLAIKADKLGKRVSTIDELSSHLGLDMVVDRAVRTLAAQEPVVLIIDQLDALSELLDRQSERLNVLLNLVHSLSGASGIHVVLSSREFEFRHDVRLATIQAESVQLQLPEWGAVAPILEMGGHTPGAMTEGMRELLRNPLHLKLFLDLAGPGDTYDSLYALLESLWERRVLVPNGAHERLNLVERLAQLMANEEELWLPAATADQAVEARLSLEQAGILVREPDGRIAFRHQVFLDFALARAFARGTQSLAQHVLERQDGLFVRPVLINGLHYLRMVSRSRYHREIEALFDAETRPHIRVLLLEFLGGRADPDAVEAQLLLPMLDSADDSVRVLGTIVGSPGWFGLVRHRESFLAWLRKEPEQAVYAAHVLGAAARFATPEVVRLLRAHWFGDTRYDFLSLAVLLEVQQWTAEAADMAVAMLGRTVWFGTSGLVRRVAPKDPALACRMLLARLELDMAAALRQAAESFSKLQADMAELSEEDAIIRRMVSSPWASVQHILKDSDLGGLESAATRTPGPFLTIIWPWLVGVIDQAADEEHGWVLCYRDDHASGQQFDREPAIIRLMLTALRGLADQDPTGFCKFVRDNESSDLLVVHRLLAAGMERLAAVQPDCVLEYLLGDPRRLSLGDTWDAHRESKMLIAAVFPSLSDEQRRLLEEAIINYTRYKDYPSEWTAEDRRNRLTWNREHRLRLLRALPEDLLSLRTRRLRQEEERALPGTPDRDQSISMGVVGAPMNTEEMERASDPDLLRLLDKITDDIERHPRRRRGYDNYARAGGAVELAGALEKLAIKDPGRAARLAGNLRSGRQETYAGGILKGLAESGCPVEAVFELVLQLNDRGFASPDFREAAAWALERCALRGAGLPETVLSLLVEWLHAHPLPKWPDAGPGMRIQQQEGRGARKDSLLFGMGGFILPHGRGTIIRALAAGCLQRHPPDVDRWVQVLESRLGKEAHPRVWAVTFRYARVLFKADGRRATDLLGRVIQNCPLVLQHEMTWLGIMANFKHIDPIESAQSWLSIMVDRGTPEARQVFGELLTVYCALRPDDWVWARVNERLGSAADTDIACGLAYGASYQWRYSPFRTAAAEILCRLTVHSDPAVQAAVATLFLRQQDELDFDPHMRRVIEAVVAHPPALMRAAKDLVAALVPCCVTVPELVVRVCNATLDIVGRQVPDIRTEYALLAEPLTRIALTLHRQRQHRENGLRLFERLLELNLREVRLALDTLDRRPVRQQSY